MDQIQIIPANQPITVTLEAQAWNIVLAALGKQPYEVVAPLIHSMTQQLQQGATALQPEGLKVGNGVDHFPGQFRG